MAHAVEGRPRRLSLTAVAHGGREQTLWATAARSNRRGSRRLESFNFFINKSIRKLTREIQDTISNLPYWRLFLFFNIRKKH
jgi:hypothetical protein